MLSCSRPSRIRWHTSVNHHLAHDTEAAGGNRENFLYELNFLYEFKPALRAASGRPQGRQRHDGHRGAGLTLYHQGKQNGHDRADCATPGRAPPRRLHIISSPDHGLSGRG
jgi:hypothetical protein